MTHARLLIALVFLFALPAPADASGPADTVTRLHQALIAMMRAGEGLGFAGRLQHIRPTVAASFRFESVARAVLGAHWRELAASDRAAMRSLLERLTAVNYASQFSRFDGEKFVLTEVKPVRAGRQLVRSEMRRADVVDVSFDYLLEPGEDGWRIVNVIANGVSDLSLKRAEYASVIRNDGFRALLAKIGQQITDLEEESASSG